MNKSAIEYLKTAFESVFAESCSTYTPLPKSGSARAYIRLLSENRQVIGMYNPDREENDVFHYAHEVFSEYGIRVPEILHYSHDKQYMLLQDLGDQTLFSIISNVSTKSLTAHWMRNAIDILIRLQTEVSATFDYKKCYPVKAFTRRSFYWDLNYFKYCFLRLQNLGLDEEALEDDFDRMVNVLSAEDIPHAVVHRDFQSRNLMIHEDELYVIDFQAVRKGPVLYDLVSLIWQAKASLSEQLKDELWTYYLKQYNGKQNAGIREMENAYPYFVLFRVLQVLGAYGLRGLHEHKLHFLQSIPFAIENLEYIFSTWPELSAELPALATISKQLQNIKHQYETDAATESHVKLLIIINSFSYKKGYPVDYSVHGGGFVFDCRSLPNPGRHVAYKTRSGLDADVIEWLEEHDAIEVFYQRIEKLVMEAKAVYQAREFNYLAVNFGCTGGQHRSVYMAERLSRALAEQPGIMVQVKHKNSKAWPKS